jgi:8-oxo-dGTP diphosphatase
MDAKRGIDFIGVTVPFVVHDGNGRFLLQKRSVNCRDEKGTWDVGGGSMEFGEEWEDAVRREVKEEIGTNPSEVIFLKAYNALRNNEGKRTHWIALVHAAKVNPGKVKINDKDKIDEIGWFNLNNLPKPLHSQMMKSLDAAKKAGIIR